MDESVDATSAGGQPPRRPFARWVEGGRRSRAGKILKIVLLIPVGLWVAYVVLANVFLNTGLMARLVSYNPESVSMHYETAWTVWPGSMHVKGFRISGQDSVLQWTVEVDEAHADVHFTELFRRKFYASRVRAEGYVLRIRTLVDPTSVTALDDAKIKALPPIPGYTNPPLKRALPPEKKNLEYTDEGYDLWTAHLEDIDTTVKEIWIEQVRYIGTGRVKGGFYFKPLRAVRVGPAVLSLRDGEIHVADQVVARLDADIDITMSQFDPMNVTGLNAFETTGARVRLSAQVPGLDVANFFMEPGGSTRVADGSGALDADLSINKGAIEPGSFLRYATSRLDIKSPDIDVTLGGEASLRIAGGGGDEAARAVVHIPRATASRPGKGLPPAVAEKVRAIFTAPSLNLGALPSKVAVDFNVVAAAVPDLQMLNLADSAPDAPVFTGGAAFFRGHIAVDPEGRGGGALRTLVKRGAMKWKDTRVLGDVTVDLALENGDIAARTAALGASRVDVRDLAITHKGETWPEWWARVDIEKAKLEKKLIEATIKLECKDAQPAVGLLDAEDVIPGWAAGLLTMEGLKASATVRRSERDIDFKLLKAEGGSLAIRGRLKKPREGKPEGAFLVRSGILSVGIDIEEDGAGVHPLAGDTWVNEKMFAMDQR